MGNIVDLVRLARDKGASDLHLVANVPPLLRIGGVLEPLDSKEPLTPEDIVEALEQLTTPEQREEFHKNLELYFATTLPGVGRIRCDVALQQGTISVGLRILLLEIPDVDILELPQVCKDLAMLESGLVIVTGPTGSGKTTTLAAMVNHINTNRRCLVVTIESPVEYIHPNRKSVITHRDLGTDTSLSFATAVKHALRQAPDVILIGEMRDLDTVAAALMAAETGHLVLTAGHTASVAQTVERYIDVFPPHERFLAQARLSSVLSGVLSQVLVPRADGSGRVAAVEIMLANAPVRNLIREGKIYLLPNVIRTHREIGMISLDEALVNLYLKGVISNETMFAFRSDRQEVEKLIGKIPSPAE